MSSVLARAARASVLLLAGALSLVFTSAASAEVYPTSGELSVVSGRTLGAGEKALWIDGGLPGVRATLVLAPTSRFNVGLRGMFAYTSPFMGFGAGVGGTLEAPMRWLVFAQNRIDLALTMNPRLFLGQGRLAGEEGVFSDDLGIGAGAEAGARVGFAVSDAITLTTGAGFEIGMVASPSANNASLIGIFTGILGFEALLSRDVAITVEAAMGYGAAPDILFARQGVVRILGGVALLL